MNRAFCAVTLLTALVAGCFGGDGPRPGGDVDAGASPDAETVTATGLAVGTDYFSAGVATWVGLPGLSTDVDVPAGVASTDPVVRYGDGKVFIVNRYGYDNVTVLDATTRGLIAQISTGSGSNPQDVAALGSKLYLPALATSGLVILDLDHPQSGVVGTIDLSSLDPDDGKPDCNSARLVGDRLFVTCGILDDDDQWLTPRGPGKVAVIDTVTDTLIDQIELDYANPVGFLHATASASSLKGDLMVATVPSYADLTQGCVDRISVSGPLAVDCLITNQELGGYASGMAFTGLSAWFAVTEGWDSEDYKALGAVRSYDVGSATLRDEPLTAAEERPFDVAVCPTGYVLVSDAAGGLRVYDGESELTEQVLDIGLPPVERGLICF
jgi:DNA-binding beta-propeller fold protein YncE